MKFVNCLLHFCLINNCLSPSSFNSVFFFAAWQSTVQPPKGLQGPRSSTWGPEAHWTAHKGQKDTERKIEISCMLQLPCRIYFLFFFPSLSEHGYFLCGCIIPVLSASWVCCCHLIRKRKKKLILYVWVSLYIFWPLHLNIFLIYAFIPADKILLAPSLLDICCLA